MNKPRTIYEISKALFPDVNGFNDLLALEETGAHVEYLYQRGNLSIDNLESFLQSDRKNPARYCINFSEPKTDEIFW